jgi:hypothetical protein
LSQATAVVISPKVAGGLKRCTSYQTKTPKTTANRIRNLARSQKISGLRVPFAFHGNRGSAGGVLGGRCTWSCGGGPGGPGISTVTGQGSRG